MCKILNFSFVLLFCIGFTQCGEHNPLSPILNGARDLTPAEKRLVESDNRFGIKLFKAIVKEEDSKVPFAPAPTEDRNVFMSPLSVSMALGMTYNGTNGRTEEAMRRTLELDDLTIQEINESYKGLIELLANLDPKVRFDLANSIWYRQGYSFEEKFMDLNKAYFDAQVRELDFSDPSAVDIINGWVNDNTNGKIDEIVDRIDARTVMFLINAIYFKGTWTYQFDEELTRDDLFLPPDGSEKSCRMMTQKGDFQYFENSNFQAVDLPYGAGDFSMVIFLPRTEKDMNSVIEEFNQENWDLWIHSFSEHDGTLQLPKFTLEYELELNDVLQALGMGIAFSGQADLTKMYRPGGLFISKVKHKTFVDVDEEGTEAAAVTSVEIRETAIAPSGFSMRVDRPFVFAIRENRTGTILFMGRIVAPTLG